MTYYLLGAYLVGMFVVAVHSGYSGDDPVATVGWAFAWPVLAVVLVVLAVFVMVSSPLLVARELGRALTRNKE